MPELVSAELCHAFVCLRFQESVYYLVMLLLVSNVHNDHSCVYSYINIYGFEGGCLVRLGNVYLPSSKHNKYSFVPPLVGVGLTGAKRQFGID